MSTLPRPRTYNQSHIAAQPHTGGGGSASTGHGAIRGRRSATRPNGEPLLHHDRSAQRRCGPPTRHRSTSAAHFLQGIAGTLELFHRSTLAFQELAGEATGHPVAVFQRIDQAGYKLPIDERILADTDTLMVFGLDHILVRTGSRARGDRRDHASG